MTKSLRFIRLPIKLDQLWMLAGQRNWMSSPKMVMDEGLALHHALAETFGKGRLQPFRLMVTPGQKTGIIYAYCTTSLAELKDTASLSGPEYAHLFDFDALMAKDMPVQFATQRRLGFDIRLRPVRRSRRLAQSAAIFEMDAFQHEMETRFPDPHSTEPKPSRETVYGAWLAERLGNAATLVKARLVHFKRHHAVRNGKASEGPDIVLQGDLTVGDPDLFAQCLINGIGRHKAYGYGMILLRPSENL
ncbi:CRISPR-associated protein Cse3 [Iodidimonas gelatinilytica]|uniref:CRISPR-associated protein Cse3 n=1 Tax=Iodidimonas gelatinilytica TaxID=1236966 RepID=A0A5A7MTD1_9PROT|nr:type I-E CRISPR-associated protein Cas6/Cse3/CasE [Iodidimonas gelatinilytica]GEQ98235.1 CRISPR-associated protein Cse3 [Iodidimonas gelatinilytica]